MTFQFDSISICFFLWVLVFMPVMAWFGYRRLSRGLPLAPKAYRFRLAFYAQFCSIFIALPVAAVNDIPLSFKASWPAFILGVIFLAVFIMAIVKPRVKPDPAIVERMRLLYAPTNRQELVWAILAGIFAGVGEEIAYRCVLFESITRISSSAALSFLICVAAFAFAHLPQGKRNTLLVALLGILFHLFYFVSEGLAVSIFVHVTYDVVLFSLWYRWEVKNNSARAADVPTELEPKEALVLD